MIFRCTCDVNIYIYTYSSTWAWSFEWVVSGWRTPPDLVHAEGQAVEESKGGFVEGRYILLHCSVCFQTLFLEIPVFFLKWKFRGAKGSLFFRKNIETKSLHRTVTKHCSGIWGKAVKTAHNDGAKKRKAERCMEVSERIQWNIWHHLSLFFF